MNETGKQFSFTRVASSTSGRASALLDQFNNRQRSGR